MISKSSYALQTAEEIIHLLKQHGDQEYAGEKVSQLQHMYQAGMHAISHTTDEELILAAFLHDLGHICESARLIPQMGHFGTMDHEQIGAAFLKQKGFSPAVVQLVGSHVAAKRYLTYSDPSYYEQLSEASKETLVYQGGPMSAAEAEEFESDPLFEEMLRLRIWDEASKDEHMEVGDLGIFQSMIIRHLFKSNP
jgi:phosphonate degradation associated HDIG domain protein